MIVRPATSLDASAISAIHNESIVARGSTMELTPKTVGDTESVISNLGAKERMIVLEDGGRVEGWGLLKSYSPRKGYRLACETAIYLRQKHAGKKTGYADAIQSELISLSRELDYHHVVVKIWARNQISIRFHKKHGFEIVGTQREIGFVDDNWEDVVIMQLLNPLK